MEQSERDLLLKTLDVLKKGRDKCVELIKTDPYIHQACFKYRKSPAAMSLVIDRYKTDVLNHHFELADNEDASVKENVANAVLLLIGNELNVKNSEFGCVLLEVLKDKRRIINEMLNTSDKAQEKFNCLLVSIERDRAKYEDEVEKIILNSNKD